MVDAPDRPAPRFPQGQVQRVTREVGEALDRWGVGPATTLVTSGARGADIIAAEQCLRRGARAILCLALPPDQFERESVAVPGTDWSARYRALLENQSVEVKVLQEQFPREAVHGDGVFARTNEWIIDLATSLGGGRPHALIVWNGREGDGPGGTRDFVRRLGHTKPTDDLEVIDPTPRTYEARQTADGPKKLLALDGGGIRGVLTLRVLGTIQGHLRAYYRNDAYVLSDYFDYIGGTSTGAVIASGLALGMAVEELQQRYRELGRTVFRKRWLGGRFWSLYPDRPLTEALEGILGSNRTLGDPDLRSLLLLVLYRTDTDSPWPLSNNTGAKYNRAKRFVTDPPDRNLDLPLTTLVRGSTAAPIYFAPQQVVVGDRPVVFQDGGVTPFNDPALLLFLMATLSEYGLGWPTGEENLLVVSVGTGRAAAVHPDLVARSVNLLFNATNLPTVFMNGAAVSQDLICRALGRCRYGDPIDREVGDRTNEVAVGGTNLFTYLRYDVDLSDGFLRDRGITDQKAMKRIRKLDSVGSIPKLEEFGADVGAAVDFPAHFQGFL